MPIEPIDLRTPRLALRRWRETDRAPFAALNQDPRVMEHFPAPIPRDRSDASIDAWTEDFALQGWSNWAVERRDTGEFIGVVGLTMPRWEVPCAPCVEVGWRLRREAWGQGFATEGAGACLRVGFEQVGLGEIFSFTAVVNRPSIAVMERIGLRNLQADFEHPAMPEGHALRRHVLYRVTREEWAARRGRASA
jgi:RimJ/RimL family protein N-acetyltransferase